MSRHLLPRELTVRCAADTRRDLLSWVAGLTDAPVWRLDASPVDEIDAAGVQLLLSLARSATQAQAALRVESPSPVLQHACRTLGLSATLLDDTSEGSRA
ncbi:MAG: STAS domain-containing protein [Piscinibacter sp.]